MSGEENSLQSIRDFVKQVKEQQVASGPHTPYPRTLNFSSSSSSTSTETSPPKERPQTPKLMALQRNPTLKELATPTLEHQPLCITFEPLEEAFELKSGMIHLLPKFHGLPGEDPNKHLKEFHVVCSSMKPQGIKEEQVKLRAFPFSLADHAKEWLYYLPSGTITTWDALKKAFLEKYFPASKATSIRKQICAIKQDVGETLYEYWERFKRLCASCPHHQISEQLLIQYFYEGLTSMDRSMIDAASGGALVDKTPIDAKNLIANMAANSQQFGTRQDVMTRRVNELSTSHLDQQLASLTQIVSNLATSVAGIAKPCGVCSFNGHMTDMCPLLQEGGVEQANALGYQGGNQPKFDPYSPTYNPGWRSHPNFSYANQSGGQQGSMMQNQVPRPPGFNQPRQAPKAPFNTPSSSQGVAPNAPSLEDLVKSMATTSTQFQQNTLAFQQSTHASIKNLELQVSQIAKELSEMRTQGSGKLPSQPLINPRENVSALTLRSGKQVEIPSKPKSETTLSQGSSKSEDSIDQSIRIEASYAKPDAVTSSKKVIFKEPVAIEIPPPFPSRLAKPKKEEFEKGILETFRKVQVNIPLLDAIQQVPRYAKFLKELCTNKRKLQGNEVVQVGETCSAILQKKLPPKLKDPGSFTIPCTIGMTKFNKVMLDLGASINVMPYSVYCTLNLGDLKETGIVVQLADRTNVYPRGVLEDVLVQVNGLVFPADFYVLDMEDDGSVMSTPLLLGRPFMRTARTKIDCYSGTLTMEFDGEIVCFNIFEEMRYRDDMHSVYSIDVLHGLSQQMLQLSKEEKFGVGCMEIAKETCSQGEVAIVPKMKQIAKDVKLAPWRRWRWRIPWRKSMKRRT